MKRDRSPFRALFAPKACALPSARKPSLKARHVLPLLGFVIPTVVIGYGFVIPHSCIAGVNELSIGFGTTILGACVTYLLGVRAALSATVE